LKTISSFLRLKLNKNIPEHKYIDHWVTLSPKAASLFQKTSLKSDNLSVIPNFVQRNYIPTSNIANKWVFVGRLTSEKGIIALVRNVPKTLQLDIYGDGPARKQLETFIEDKTNVQLKGDIDRSKLLKLLPTYVGGFVPSFGVEGIPTTFLEFSATGLPIIGWEMNSTSDFIHKYNCGVTLNDFNTEAISRAVNTILNDRANFSKNSLYMWESEFSEKIWINNVNSLFELVKSKRNNSA
jgi:glycosyltransferase involved in cell wall biosynthesis